MMLLYLVLDNYSSFIISDKINDGAVTTEKIADGAIVYDKLSDETFSYIQIREPGNADPSGIIPLSTVTVSKGSLSLQSGGVYFGETGDYLISASIVFAPASLQSTKRVIFELMIDGEVFHGSNWPTPTDMSLTAIITPIIFHVEAGSKLELLARFNGHSGTFGWRTVTVLRVG